MTLESIVGIGIGYLVGSVDFAVIAARVRGLDIYEIGSGNPGTANVLRNFGWKVAAPVMVGDLAKGAIAALVGVSLGGRIAGFAAGFAAVVGHCFPVWHRFRGGKGVATALGAMLALDPLVGFGLAALWAVLWAATRISSVGSLAAMVAMTPVMAARGEASEVVGWTLATAALVLIRHHDNIRRLLAGSEHQARAANSDG